MIYFSKGFDSEFMEKSYTEKFPFIRYPFIILLILINSKE